MANVYYKIDGDNCYYSNEAKSGYTIWEGAWGGNYHPSQDKNVVVELSNDTFILPNYSSYLFYKATNSAFSNSTKWDTSNVRAIDNLFSGCSNLTSVDVSSFSFSGQVDCSSMFYNCSSLVNIPGLSSLNFIASSAIGAMFYKCKSLIRADLSGITCNGGSLNYAFFECSSLINVKLPHCNYCSGLDYTFYGCESLTSIDLSNIDYYRKGSGNRFYMGYAFLGCRRLTQINLGPIETLPSDTKLLLHYAFYGCSNLTEINLGEFIGTVEETEAMCSGCSKLKTVHLDKAKFYVDSQASNSYRNVFSGCVSLEHIYVKYGTNWRASDTLLFQSCVKLPNYTSTDQTRKRANTIENFGYFSPVYIPEEVTVYIKDENDQWLEVSNSFIKTGTSTWKDSSIWV